MSPAAKGALLAEALRRVLDIAEAAHDRVLEDRKNLDDNERAEADANERTIAEARAALAAHDAEVSTGGCVANGAHVWCNGHIVATAHGLTIAPYRAARIAACINACTGIADPGALVQAARDAVDWIGDYVPDSVGGRDFTLADLRRALGGAA